MPIPYTLIRCDRRTLALIVDRTGALVARAPRRMPLRDIEAFIALKEPWILKKRDAARQKTLKMDGQALQGGTALSFGGETLTVSAADIPFAFVYHGALLLPSSQPLHKALAAWLLDRAKARLPSRVAELEARTELYAKSLHFSTARTRWGSMNTKGAMRLNAALLLCPDEIIDYVIVHELAHLRQPNHSPAFWATVHRFMPDCGDRRTWLKRNSHLIQCMHPLLKNEEKRQEDF